MQTLLYMIWPVEFLAYCHRRYGDTFTIDTVLFGEELTITHPEDIRRIFTGDPATLNAGEANLTGEARMIVEPLLGRRSVMLLDGREHQRQRRLLMPPFHGERMAAYGAAMRDAAARALEGWPIGEPFPLYPSMQRITLETIVHTIFGAEGPRERDELRNALRELMDRVTASFSMFTLPWLRRLGFGLDPLTALHRAKDRTDALILRSIAVRRARRAEGAPPRDDVLSMLVEARDEEGNPMSDGELRDELMTLLAAGLDTTANALCWAFDLLVSSPAVLDRLRAELVEAGRAAAPEPAAVARLPYLDAVLKEVLRFRPVIPAVGRRLTAPFDLRCGRVPAGTMVVPATMLTHMDPAYYPEPEVFQPERFLDKKPDPYTWFPFGGGARRCLGMQFALYEMKIVVAEVLSRVSIRKARPGPTKIRVHAFAHGPDGGAIVVVDERAPRRSTGAG